MIDRGKGGKIINMASQAGRRGEALVAVYCSTKAAVISLTQSAGLDLIKYGINVNAIAPGPFRTMIAGGRIHVPENEAAIYHQTQEDAGEAGWRDAARAANDQNAWYGHVTTRSVGVTGIPLSSRNRQTTVSPFASAERPHPWAPTISWSAPTGPRRAACRPPRASPKPLG